MTAAIDVTAIEEPTVIDVWAPHCTACRAMRPDLEAVSTDYAGEVRRIRLDASQDPDAVRKLGVLGTPSVLGVRDGAVLFRTVGRRSRGELEAMFAALVNGDSVRSVPRTDVAIRIGGGAALAAAGMLAGPAWPLVVGGIVITGYGAIGAWRT